MSQNTYTTTDLLALVNILGHVPQANATFSASNLLLIADLELRTSIAKQLKQADEGYFQTIIEYDQDDSGEYRIPPTAIAASAYSIQIRNGQAIWPVSRQQVSEMTTTTFPSGGNWSCFIRSNTLYMLPVQFEGVLRITYERRPSKLVATTACAQVASIAGQVITVNSLPSGWAVDDYIDLQASQPQFDVLSTCQITNISGLDITLSGDVSALSVNDYLCQEGQTCVPQIPVEFQQLLAQRIVCKIYEIQGYLDKLAAAEKILERMVEDLTALITPRIQASPKVINPSWGGRKPGNSWARFNPPAGRSSS